jgi:type I restriction enzyme, S subunit
MKIHNGWKKVKFGDVVNKVNDKVHNREEWTFERYIGGEHFENGEIRVTRSNPIEGNEEVIGPAFHMRFKPGQVLYVTRNPRLRKGGMVDFEGVCSNVSFVMETDETQLLQSLLPFIIQTEDFVKHTCNNAHGSTNPFLNWKDIAKYEFLLPPLEEQKKISEVLWSIENHINNENKQIKYLHLFKNKLLKKYFLDSSSDKICLNKISEIIMGQSPPSSSYNPLAEGLPFFQGKADFGKRYPDVKIYTNKPTKIAESDSILFTVRAPVGELNFCNVRCCIGRGLASISAKEDIPLNYIYYALEILKKEINRMSQGTTFTAINSKELRNFKIISHSNQEIKLITKNLDLLYGNIDILTNNTKTNISLRNKLSNELLKGELRLK